MAIRLTVLIAAVVFAARLLSPVQDMAASSRFADNAFMRVFLGIPAGNLQRVLPAMSPFLGVSAALGARYAAPVFLFCTPVILFALIRGRWFCRNICPTGLIAEYAGKLGRRGRVRFAFPRIGRWLVAGAAGGAVLGYPFFLWLDPLSIFNGFAASWRAPLTLAGILPVAGLTLITALSVWRPGIWCYRICPLGATQDLLGRAGLFLRTRTGRRETAPAGATDRRAFLGLIAGGIAGTLATRLAGVKRAHPVRPPGSADEGSFNALCARCGNCIRCCPQKIIRADFGRSGLAGLMTPVIDIGPGYCAEWCNECNRVCPTGAITHLTLDAKRNTAIGTARVDRSACLAWNDRQYCMVCDEYCPYHAIKTIEHGGVNCPEIDPEICRGCGLCQTQCPADKTAIVVAGTPQRRLRPAFVSAV